MCECRYVFRNLKDLDAWRYLLIVDFNSDITQLVIDAEAVRETYLHCASRTRTSAMSFFTMCLSNVSPLKKIGLLFGFRDDFF